MIVIVVVVKAIRICLVHDPFLRVVQAGHVIVEAVVEGGDRAEARLVVVVAGREQRHFRVHAAHLLVLLVKVGSAQATLLVRCIRLGIQAVADGRRGTYAALSIDRLVGRPALVLHN